MTRPGAGGPVTVFLVAGEHSGDQLGFKLMRAMVSASPRPIRFLGVGGERMEAEGLRSLFPMADIAVNGIVPVVRRLPSLLARIAETARAVVAARPDVLVLIDSPDFTHRVAKRARQLLPDLPVVDYVSPTVWAWRTGRAPAMRSFVDHVLALLPFEPDAYRRLGGPACTYVGHPLVERLDELRPSPSETVRRDALPPVVLVLPGSRRSEIRRLMADFGAALGRVAKAAGPFDLVLPAVDHLADEIEERAAAWPVRPRVVRGEAEKLRAFRIARAALAASGTVTLELALSGVPTVVAYRVSPVEMQLRFLVKVPSIVLPNLITGDRSLPEFIGSACTPDSLATALLPLLRDGPERHRQLDAMARLDGLMRLDAGRPSERAAAIVLGSVRGL